MSAANSVSASGTTPTISILKSANKQPELALKLLQQTMSAMQQQSAAQSVPAAVNRLTSPAGTGQLLDIIA